MFIDVVEALARVVAEVVKGLAKGLASAVLPLRSYRKRGGITENASVCGLFDSYRVRRVIARVSRRSSWGWGFPQRRWRFPRRGISKWLRRSQFGPGIQYGRTLRNGPSIFQRIRIRSRTPPDGPKNGSPGSVARRARPIARVPSQFGSAAYGCPIKCQSRRLSAGSHSAPVSTGFNARERRLGAE
jgi:hypothetical protein